MNLRHLERLSRLLIRIALWVAGAGYLLIEAREVVATTQITNIRTFALLFVLSSHYRNISTIFFYRKTITIHALLSSIKPDVHCLIDGSF